MSVRQEVRRGGAETVVTAWRVIPRSRNRRSTDDEIGVRIDVAAVDVDHTRSLHNRLAFVEGELDAVLAWLHLERETTGTVREHSLAVACVDVDHLDGPAVERGGAFRTADSAADRAVCLDRLRAGVDDGSPGRQPARLNSTAAVNGDQRTAAAVRAVERIALNPSSSTGLQAEGHRAAPAATVDR